jgi:hypothetical protein
LGFKVINIPSGKHDLTPDFEVIGNRCKYTIELKIKNDDLNEILREREALSRGEIAERSIPVGPRNRLAGIIKKGVRQMSDYDPAGDSFRVIWLHSAGQDPCLHYKRFHSTLFGTENLVSLSLPHIITCYYFHESAFFRWRDSLDGALLTYENTAQLCINSLSNRAEQFRQSELVVNLSEGLCDPKLEESNDHVMIVDCDIDRNESEKVLSYLRVKYHLNHLQTIPMVQHTGIIELQLPTDE